MNTKHCARCDTTKPITEFFRDRSRPDGLGYTCKQCKKLMKRTYRLSTGARPHSDPRTEEELEEREERRKEYQREYQRKYNIANREKIKARQREHQREYRYIETANKQKQRANKLHAVPLWSETSLIRDFYKEAFYRRKAGEDVVVDHIVPLGGDTVCGLHCLANLQYLTNLENGVKSDLDWPDKAD